MRKQPIFLGLETSCDETAVAVVQGTEILAHRIYSQDHRQTGGVVPQNAARQHLEILAQLTQSTLQDARLAPSDLDGIGVTAGPGLVAGLMVGVLFAKGLSHGACKPLWAIHHLEAHGLIGRLYDPGLCFPFLLLLMSGGHCLLAHVHKVGHYTVLGQTYDDAAGECLDKVARAMGGEYPGGPYIQRHSQGGDPRSIDLPVPLQREKSCNFSFSGLKTACVQWIDSHRDQLPARRADFCASLQRVMADSLCARLAHGLAQTGLKRCVMAGGVAANTYFRARLGQTCEQAECTMTIPPPAMCTDNGAMIAWAAHERWAAGIAPNSFFDVRPSWPLQDLSSAGVFGCD
jgi:N6-L-threonylcarbamoyladenine synthase